MTEARPLLDTPRLRLRPFRADDWPGFALGWLLARLHWGRGYAREAAAVALRHAFEVLQRDRVISLIRPGNARSVAVAEAISDTLHGSIELLGGEALAYEVRR
jgi:hypothetical protein